MRLWKVTFKIYIFGKRRYVFSVLANTESEMLNAVKQYPIARMYDAEIENYEEISDWYEDK